MFVQMQTLPPALERLAKTPVLASEMPSGFSRVKIVRLAPNPTLGTLGAVRVDFVSAHTIESASYALLRTNAAALHLAQTEAKVNGGSLVRVRAVAVGRFAVAVAAETAAGASSLLHLAVAHLRRSGA